MKRKQSVAFCFQFTVMETTVSSATFVEFMPQMWIIPPKNKNVVHKERDNVKYLYPRRLAHQTKDNYIKYVKQAKFNCITSERNEKWELKQGRILKMGIGSLEEALDVEKFYSDYFSTTEAETQDKEPSPAQVPKKILRKKKSVVQPEPVNDSESEDEDQGGNISNYNIAFQGNDQILDMFTLEENAILDVNINQLISEAVFEEESGNLPIQTFEETLASERNMSTLSNEKVVTIDVPIINQTSSELVQREVFDEDQQMETASDTIDQQEQQRSLPTSCCKSNQKVLNKIDYVQKKLFKEMTLMRQESRSNRQLLLRVLSFLNPTEMQAEDVRDDPTEETSCAPIQTHIDMAEVDSFNAKFKATFPILSSDRIIDFNKSLKDDKTFAEYLYGRLSQIKGDDVIKTTRKILKELCGVSCLKEFTWLGTKKMKCFQDLHLIIEMISKLIKDKFPDCDAIDIIEKVVKQRTKSAKEAKVTILAAEAAAAVAKLDSTVNKGDNDATKDRVASSHHDDNQVAGSSQKLSIGDVAAIGEKEIAEHDSTDLQNEKPIFTASKVQHNDVNKDNVGFSDLDDNQVAGTARKESINANAENGSGIAEQQSA